MVYIRPLRIEDAEISWKWRNDSELWKFTGSRPDITVTPDIEKEWIYSVIARTDQKRFAICVKETDQYIGNIQLTNLNNEEAQYHIFIGEKSFWGRGCAKEATYLILHYAFKDLKLTKIYLEVHVNNIAALSLYRKCGFRKINSEYTNYVLLELLSNDFHGKS